MSCSINDPNVDFSNSMSKYNSAYNAYKAEPSISLKNGLDAAHTNLTNTLNCYIGQLNTATVYDEKTYAKIITEYNSIRNRRADLDMKLREIYDLQDTIPRENQQMFDSTMLSVTLCAILASSVVYFIFSE